MNIRESIKRILKEIEEDRVQIRLGRSADRHFGKVQNIIIKVDDDDITSQDDVPGLGKMNIVIKDDEIIVGDIFIPEKYRRQGIATVVYQKISDYFGLPIVSSKTKGFNQTMEGGYIWKDRERFEPRNLQESIRRILREETNDYSGFNDLSENDLYNISEWGLNGEYYFSGCNDDDDPVKCGVEDFKQFLTTPWPLGLGNVPNNPIIYRIIKLKNPEDLSRTNLGHSWFSNPKQYEEDCFFDMLDYIRPTRFNDSIYILKGKTNINNIDVPHTLWERSTQWCENEIVIINDSEIELLTIKKLN
jgi:hypothetical protein